MRAVIHAGLAALFTRQSSTQLIVPVTPVLIVVSVPEWLGNSLALIGCA